MDYSKTFAVVPETPEGQKNRRRSTRRSTMSSTVATASILRQIAGKLGGIRLQPFEMFVSKVHTRTRFVAYSVLFEVLAKLEGKCTI